MASNEVNIDRSDDWFAGEDKRVVFTVFKPNGKTIQSVVGWTCEWRLFDQRTKALLLTIPALPFDPANGQVSVLISGIQTINMRPGTYVMSLWRTDVGLAGVLAHGTAVLRTDSEA